MISSFLAPKTSFLFVWPLLSSVTGLTFLMWGSDRLSGPWTVAGILLFAAGPVLLLWVPVVRQLYDLLGLLAPGLLALAAAFGCSLLLPCVAFGGRRRRWLLSGLTLLVGVGCLLSGSAWADFDTRRPKPNSIFYILNADSGDAVWASYDRRPDTWTRQFLGPRPIRAPLDSYLPNVPLRLLPSEAPRTTQMQTRIVVEAVTDRAGRRTVRLRLVAPPQTGMLIVSAPSRAEISKVEVQGVEVVDQPAYRRAALEESRGGSKRRWTLGYWNPPLAGIRLTLHMSDIGALPLTIAAQTPGLPAAPGLTWRVRPNWMMPQPVYVDSSTIVAKTFILPASS
jgi:hypothetical protein